MTFRTPRSVWRPSAIESTQHSDPHPRDYVLADAMVRPEAFRASSPRRRSTSQAPTALWRRWVVIGIILRMTRLGLASAAAVLCIAPAALATASEGGVTHCRRFIVGQANSTAYPHHRLPARGTATGVSCATLERIARRVNDGTYRIPPGSTAVPPNWGKAFTVRDRRRRWACQLQNRGASGPTYAVRCRSGRSQLAWNTG
jgi:hypothetical protein